MNSIAIGVSATGTARHHANGGTSIASISPTCRLIINSTAKSNTARAGPMSDSRFTLVLLLALTLGAGAAYAVYNLGPLAIAVLLGDGPNNPPQLR